jgi:hypothetical protein
MKHAKQSSPVPPTTAPESTRLTPSEIDALREDARQMDAKFRAIYTARRIEQAICRSALVTGRTSTSASAQASNAVFSGSLLIFPALFAAGMMLVDTTDGVLMLGAYGWAYRNPMRKLFYNLTITFVSVLMA